MNSTEIGTTPFGQTGGGRNESVIQLQALSGESPVEPALHAGAVAVAAHEESVISAVGFHPPVATRGAADMCEELKPRGPKVFQDLPRSPGRMGRTET